VSAVSLIGIIGGAMSNVLARHWRLAIMWVVSLVVTGVLSASGQPDFRTRQLPMPDTMITQLPTIISGAELGFRIERMENNTPIGRLVVRIDGRWVDTRTASSIVALR
jgi:hypothetical protein